MKQMQMLCVKDLEHNDVSNLFKEEVYSLMSHAETLR